jgi:hypothetical protein
MQIGQEDFIPAERSAEGNHRETACYGDPVFGCPTLSSIPLILQQFQQGVED